MPSESLPDKTPVNRSTSNSSMNSEADSKSFNADTDFNGEHPAQITRRLLEASRQAQNQTPQTAQGTEPSNRLRARILHTLKPIASFLSVQILAQIFSMLCGLIIVRAMTKSEYAYYTLAISLQSMIILLADVGVGSALSGIGGRIWQDHYRLGQLVNTGLQLRRKFTIISILCVGPILLWMLVVQHASWSYAVVLTLLVTLTASTALINGILRVPARLHSRVKQLQDIDLAASGLRLIAVLATYRIYLNSATAVIITALSYVLENRMLQRWVGRDADMNAPTNAEDAKVIVDVVKQQAPVAIYYCVQGQLNILLVSFFGKANNIAEVGALSRLSIITMVFDSLMLNLLMPKFARAQNKADMKRVYWGVVVSYTLIYVVIFFLLVIFKNQALWLLGKGYSQLSTELLITVAGNSLLCVAGVLARLNSARAWVSYSWIYVPVSIVWNIILLCFLNLSKTYDAVLFGALACVPAFIVNIPRSYFGFRDFQEPQQT